MAKKRITKKKKLPAEEDIFKAFGVGKGEVSLRKFISGQRKINGRLYQAIDLIVEALRSGPGKKNDSLIAKASEINNGVLGQPPGCKLSNHQGPGH